MTGYRNTPPVEGDAMSERDGQSRVGPILVRCSPEIVEQLATEDSEPVVILGIDRQDDGTYDMVLRRPYPDAEKIAREFHATYEALAPMYGYETRPESAVEWDDVPEANRLLMVNTVEALIENGVIR